MVKKNYVPECGDYVFLDFDPQAGHEKAGHRPAIVVSPLEYNRKTKLCIAFPITKTKKGYPFEVETNSPHVTGVINADQIKNLDWDARGVYFVGKASPEVIEELIAKFQALLPFT